MISSNANTLTTEQLLEVNEELYWLQLEEGKDACIGRLGKAYFQPNENPPEELPESWGVPILDAIQHVGRIIADRILLDEIRRAVSLKLQLFELEDELDSLFDLAEDYDRCGRDDLVLELYTQIEENTHQANKIRRRMEI